jgi:Flp pilus assembly protein TadG
MKRLTAPFNERLQKLVTVIGSGKPIKRLKTFKVEQSGNVGMLFGGTLMMMASVVGGAIDYGRAINARSQTQNALDAASLAGGRVLQLGGTAAKAVDVAQSVYGAQKSNHTSEDTVTFQLPTSGNTTITPSGKVSVNTPFLSIIGIDKLAVVADAATVSGSCVGPSCGDNSNTGTSIEISLMLDTTGSMQGDKLAALKVAAKDLIDITVWNDQSKFTSKIALAPFANSVNVGSYFNAVTGVSGTYNCVVERIGVNEFTDVSPAGAGKAPKPGLQLTPTLAAASNMTMVPWNQSSSCGEATKIEPLTPDKVKLKAAIDGMQAQNATAGALGTAWAWYLLSPEWSNVFTGSAAPLPYSQLTELTEENQPKLRKIAILMTDGAYNTHQQDAQGLTDVQIQDKAKALCSAMKAKGIQVYTIGFQVGTSGDAVNTLTDCASSHVIDTGASVKNFYNAETSTALQAAFRDIALQISKLRLTR